MNLQNRKRLTDLENKLTVGRVRDSEGVWDGHTAILKMDNQQGPIVQHMEFCSMLCGSMDEREIWERMDTCICMAKDEMVRCHH